MGKYNKTEEEHNTARRICVKFGMSNYDSLHENAVRVCKAMDKSGMYYWKAGEMNHGVGRVLYDHKEKPVFHLLSKTQLFNDICEVAYGENKGCLPPRKIARYIYETPGIKTLFKPLEQIIRIPVFSSDGKLMIKPGYYARDKVIYIPHKDIDIKVSSNPTEEEIREAKSVLENDVLADFEFRSPADKAHAMAYLLLFFARKMIDGPTPLHIFEANGSRVAGFLMRKLTPDRCVILDNPTDSEFRKNVRRKLIYKLEEGVSAFCLDNISKLKLPALEHMLSVQKYCDRIPGKNKMIDAEIKWILAAAGRKVVTDTYMARRSIKARFVYNRECPEFYEDEDVKNMNKIIQSGLTLIQAWIAAGQPRMNKMSLGRFEKWSKVIGSILAFHGYPCLLGNYTEIRDEADKGIKEWRAFLGAWWETFGDKTVTTRDLLPLAKAKRIYLGKNKEETSKRKYLFQLLNSKRDAVTNVKFLDETVPLRLIKEVRAKEGSCWSLQHVQTKLKIYKHDENS